MTSIKRLLGRVSVPFALIVAAIVLVAAGGITYVLGPDWGGRESAPGRDVGVVPTAGPRTAAVVSPDRIVIPALHERAPVVTVGTTNRELDIPLDPRIAGWWDGGAKPGAKVGTAIIAGHINYAGVQGAFADIGQLNPGDMVIVHGKRHGKRVAVRFRVTGVRTYAKTALPYQEIFDQHSVGRLALVTCGGPFDAGTGNYLDNIVAFAVPV